MYKFKNLGFTLSDDLLHILEKTGPRIKYLANLA
uniref:Uncharacterized protein n=1 Tax=Ciona intestinalis TaxID=7719 RepID=H2XW01_CIOIN